MEKLRIKFCDFWQDFCQDDNYFLTILSKAYSIELSEEPDVVFYSVFGKEHLKYNQCLKVKFIGENIRYNDFEADYSIGFDYPTSSRHFRWPLYHLYGNPFDLPTYQDEREKFCCVVTSNPKGKLRHHFLDLLTRFESVDSGGKFRNNIGGPVVSKSKFLQEYRFSFAFENSSYPGYTTEKLFESKSAGTVPIYWGNPRISNEFNPEAFINVHDFSSLQNCIDHILKLNDDPDELNRIRRIPLIPKDRSQDFMDTQELENWLFSILKHRKRYLKIKPLSFATSLANRVRTQAIDRTVSLRMIHSM
jgi:alpha(1,3/1,4) fucosyltransferase